MRRILLLALAAALASGCARPSRAPQGQAVPMLRPEGAGFAILGFDAAVDDSAGIHVVFSLARPGLDAPPPVQYARGRPEADSVRWDAPRVLLPEGGPRPRVVVAGGIVHVLAGERLRHLASTNGGRGWHDLGTLIEADSTRATHFDVAVRGESLLVAAAGPRTLPLPDGADSADVAEIRRDLHAIVWVMGNRRSSRRLETYRSGNAYELDPRIAVDGALVDVACGVAWEADTTAGVGRIDRIRSTDGGASWGAVESHAGGTLDAPDARWMVAGGRVLVLERAERGEQLVLSIEPRGR